jgi:Concanavalin A-like lectin/glucanases superfamily
MKTIALSLLRLIILAVATVTSANAALVLYYNFDDGAASVTDMSGHGHSGTINGPMYTAPGMGYNNTPGRSMDFNGGGDIIQVDDGLTAFDSLATTGAATIAFWIFGDTLGDPRPGSPCTNFSAFNATGSRQLMGHVPWEDGIVYFDAGDAGGGAVPGVNRLSKDATADQFEGKWNHWMFIKEGSGPTGTSSIYVNNTLFQTGTTTGAFGDIDSFFVGGNGNTFGEGYHGLIDEFAVWDHALSAAERTRVFNGNVIPEPSSATLLAVSCVALLARRRRG